MLFQVFSHSETQTTLSLVHYLGSWNANFEGHPHSIIPAKTHTTSLELKSIQPSYISGSNTELWHRMLELTSDSCEFHQKPPFLRHDSRLLISSLSDHRSSLFQRTNLLLALVINLVPTVMVLSKFTCPTIASNTPIIPTLIANSPNPIRKDLILTQAEDVHDLVTPPTIPTPQNVGPPRVRHGTFQVLQTFQPPIQPLHGQTSKQHFSQPIVHGHKMLHSLQ